MKRQCCALKRGEAAIARKDVVCVIGDGRDGPSVVPFNGEQATPLPTADCFYYYCSKLSLSTTTTTLPLDTMLSRSAATLARKIVPRSAAARAFSSEATADATAVTLNLSVPYDSIYHNTPVDSVIIPGTEGEYGITAGHVPYVAQMKPGVLQVLFEGAEAEKYFVAGGYAVTHANSVTVSSSRNGLIDWLENKGRNLWKEMTHVLVFSFSAGCRLCGSRQVGRY